MKTFTAFSSLFFSAFVVTPILAQEPKNDLFTRLDANKDGKVVRDELPENQKPTLAGSMQIAMVRSRAMS